MYSTPCGLHWFKRYGCQPLTLPHTMHTQHSNTVYVEILFFLALANQHIQFHTYLPLHLRIMHVSIIESSNRCMCALHPDGCRNTMMLERHDHGAGMQLQLEMTGEKIRVLWY